MSQIIARDTQMLEQDALVEMFELDATGLGHGVLRFAPGPYQGHPVRFNGYEYSPLPIEAEGFKWDGQGTPPTPTLTLSAMSPSLASMIRNSNDLVGVPVRRLRTYRRYLDDGLSPDPGAVFPVEEYVVERKASQNSIQVSFELSVSFDQEGRMIPGRQVIRDTCTHVYRRWDGEKFVYDSATCPYAGSAIFTASGQVATGNALDRCGKRLSDCELRFPSQALPFYGFPGAGRL